MQLSHELAWARAEQVQSKAARRHVLWGETGHLGSVRNPEKPNHGSSSAEIL